MFQGSPYNAYKLQLHTQVTLSKSRTEATAMPMICSLIQHGFPSVAKNNIVFYLLLQTASNKNLLDLPFHYT